MRFLLNRGRQNQFNRLRRERGHLFQGRYKSLAVDPDKALGPLCHYLHLNPVRAQVRPVATLSEWPWSSMAWLMHPAQRAAWYDPRSALSHAGGLADTAAGRRKYVEYLAWLAKNEPAQKEMRFAEMSKGWLIGTGDFAQTMVREHRDAVGRGQLLATTVREVQETVWSDELNKLLRRLRRRPQDLVSEGKSVGWKLALAAALKAETTVTNRWLATTLHMGNLHEVSRKVSAWMRQPDPGLAKQLKFTPKPYIAGV